MDQNYNNEPLHDVLTLPSKGMFYPNKKSTVKVSYLTAKDENLLTSPNLLQNGNMIPMLLDRKVLDKEIRPEDMLDGDRNAILFFLRSTGYGEKYEIELSDPANGSKFNYTVDLSNIGIKEINITPDEKGECDFMLPVSKKQIKFKYLSYKENEQLVKSDEERMNKMGQNAESQLRLNKLIAQVMEIDGNRDRMYITSFIENSNLKDVNELRLYIENNEPGLDLKLNVKAPSGEFFFTQLPITTKFLWPYLNI